MEITFGMHARPAHFRVRFVHENRKAERTEKTVLGCFHEAEEIGIMHDPCHVSVGKLDAPDRFKFVSHAGNLNFGVPIYEAKFRAASRHMWAIWRAIVSTLYCAKTTARPVRPIAWAVFGARRREAR